MQMILCTDMIMYWMKTKNKKPKGEYKSMKNLINWYALLLCLRNNETSDEALLHTGLVKF